MRNYWEKKKYLEYNRKQIDALGPPDIEFGFHRTPWWIERWWFDKSNPPSSFRKKWRRESRTRQNRALRLSRDHEELVIEHRISRLTYIYDWY